MPIEIDAPDGSIAEFPDGTPPDVMKAALAKRYPKPLTTAETLADVGDQAIRGLSKSIVGTATAPYRLLKAASDEAAARMHAQGYKSIVLPDEATLPAVEEMELYKPFLKQPEPASVAGRYARAAGEAVGASAIPGAALTGAAPRLAAMAPTTLPRAIGQAVAAPIAARPGAAAVADVVASTGAGVAQQGAEEAGFGPPGQAVAGIVGAVTPLALAGAARRLTRAANEAAAGRAPHAQMAQRLAAEPGTGAGPTLEEVAESVAGGANRQALDILGQEMVRNEGRAGAAATATIDRLMGEQGITRATATGRVRELLRSQEGSELLFAEQPAVARAITETRGTRPAQRGPAGIRELEAQTGRVEEARTQRELERIANAFTGDSAATVRNAVAGRMEALREQLRQRFSAQPFAPGTMQDADALVQRMTRAAQAEYAATYGGPGRAANVNYGVLHGLLQRMVDRHLNRMAGRSGEQADALRRAIDGLFIELPTGQRVVMPSLQMAQDMRGGIRGMISGAERSGRSDIVNTLQPLYSDMTRIMERASPSWARANRRWADMRIGERARELGEAFAERAGPRYRADLIEFRQLAPEMQDLVRIEFAQRLVDKVDNAGGTHDLAKLFDKPAMRAAVRDLFGNEASVELSRLIRDNQVATKSYRMMGGSPTQPRQQLEAMATGDIDLLAAIDQASVSNFRNAAVRWVANKLKEGRNRELAGIATTPMRNVPAVAEHLERMRRANARMRDAQQPRYPQLAPAGALAPATLPYEGQQAERTPRRRLQDAMRGSGQ
jgi:hypothetical protein